MQVTPQWQRVKLSEAFVDPVVMANAVNTGGRAPALIGIRHVEPTGFEIRLQHTMDGAGTPGGAVAGFLVLEQGTYTLSDGTLVEAGSAVATLSEASHTMPFSRPFNRIPVLLTAVSSDDEVAPVSSRIQSVTKSDLRINLYGGGSAAHASDNARLSYIAWEPSTGTLQGITFEAQRAKGVGHGQWHSLVFLGAFDPPPVLLAEVQGGGSGHPLTIRWDAMRADGFEVTIDAGPQGDDAHDASAEVGYIALR